ncbi:MAG: glycoside hydrolase family 2 protein, partial [Ruminiclostridium sp.]|nr:glycoside hydrolase family 2 protein [Ruminiclostridium sp.]
LHLDVKVSSTDLSEGISYDMAAVRVRILDENNNSAPYAQLPITFSVSGAAELAGPSTATAEGGMCGTYIRTTGTKGTAELTIHTEQTEDVIINFNINTEERERNEEKWN